ncbi:hypothetical protein A2W14_05065 [Candidatus Gottesmanbacteria bacterium RBG_16_37_8]|uniref:Uncharacterized protein n=1 Tax=Candidatus Gottesmanbacteria bacterium RBG_16_37_8 TaxID=1798371 RepID=A0A1F5YU38_9BACT|nr:MAG: hypothetical protein A2W14_05065 [Candidatus Gottesmanbacteria bacterium RBG_16_37_8]
MVREKKFNEDKYGKLEFHDVLTANDATQSLGISKFFPLLLTPDDYIAGNINFAQELRRFLASRMKIDGTHFDPNAIWDTAEHLDAAIKDFFIIYFKGWPFIVHELSPKKIKEKQDRFGKILDERASQAKIIPKQAYKTKFLSSLNKITPPNLDVFLNALAYSDGKLRIRKIYGATGRK